MDLFTNNLDQLFFTRSMDTSSSKDCLAHGIDVNHFNTKTNFLKGCIVCDHDNSVMIQKLKFFDKDIFVFAIIVIVDGTELFCYLFACCSLFVVFSCLSDVCLCFVWTTGVWKSVSGVQIVCLLVETKRHKRHHLVNNMLLFVFINKI